METTQKNSVEISCSSHFMQWLYEEKISLAFTTYQTNRLFLIGLKSPDKLSTFERLFDRPMGLYVTPERLVMSTRYQIWNFDNTLPEGELHSEMYDKLYVPRQAWTTGDIDTHDVTVDKNNELLFVNTRYSCLGRISDKYSFKPVWQPPFITKLAPEDRCHLNGLAMKDGEAGFVSAVSRSDVAVGWRQRREEGGVIIDVKTSEIVAKGFSMPHSPRYYQGKLWVLNSGEGEFGYIDINSGKFVPVAFCPGYLRGLCFHKDYAIVGLSKPRHNKTFAGLELDNKLLQKDADARCGLMVIDLRNGNIAHWLQLEGLVTELYDVQVIEGVRCAMSLGFRTDEIQRFIAIEKEDGRPEFHALATLNENPTGKEDNINSNSMDYTQINAQVVQHHLPKTTQNNPLTSAIPNLTNPQNLNVGAKSGNGEVKYQGSANLTVASILNSPYESLTFPSLKQQSSIRKINEPLVGAIAMKNNQVCGAILVEPYPDGQAKILSFYVLKEHRNFGIGNGLLSTMEGILKKLKANYMSGTFRSDWGSVPAIRALLQKNNWVEPSLNLYLCKASKIIMNAPWFDKFVLPADYEIFNWKSGLKQQERDYIINRQAKENWYPSVLNPFQLEDTIEPVNSLGLRYKGQLVGWLITHRIAPETIQYTSLFVSPELQKMGRGIPMIAEAVRLQHAAGIPFGAWQVEVTNKQMIDFVDRRLKPYLTVYTESYVSKKDLK